MRIREFKQSDANFIISTWVRSYYSLSTGYKEKSSVFYSGMEKIIKDKYSKGELMPFVACLPDDEDYIIAFAVFSPDYTLHYCYTKEAYQKLGACKALLKHFYKDRKEITVSHWTKGINFIRRHYRVNYNRFKFF